MKSSQIGLTLVGILFLGCSGNSDNATGGGQTNLGGNAATSGGALTTGGTIAVSAGGTAAATGGTVAATGGATSASATGGANPATGGRATGGASSATGGRATGGASPATGGRATGGAPPSTGGSETGGTSAVYATGGQTTTGGKSSTGSNTGGQSMGGKSSGGTSSAGGTTSAGGAAAQSSGCGKAPTIASSQYNNGTTIPITVGTMQRRFILNVPTNYDNTHPYRLIIAWHELNGNDKEMYNQKYYGLLPLSNNSTIFVAPNGQKNGAACTGTGSGDSGCGWPNPNDSDLALADAVVAQLESNFCIDTNRIFATGWSYGGSMSYRTACSRPQGGTASWGVRGVAVYSGSQLSGTCTPSKAVAYYGSHGTHDSVLPYANGVGLAQNFAKANGCTWATPTQVTSGAHVCTKLTGCTAGYPLEFCSFNGDHTPYPDNGNASTSWGPQEVWTFLSQF